MYPALGISTALMFGITLGLIAFLPRRADISAAYDDVWIFRAPVRLAAVALCSATTLAIGGIWLLALGASGAFDIVLNGQVPRPLVMGVGMVAGIFSTLCALGLTGALLFTPDHSLLSMMVDDDTISVRRGYRRPILISWKDVVDLQVAGPEQPQIKAELTLVYSEPGTHKLGGIHFTESIVGIDPDTLADIFEARWTLRTQK